MNFQYDNGSTITGSSHSLTPSIIANYKNLTTSKYEINTNVIAKQLSNMDQARVFSDFIAQIITQSIDIDESVQKVINDNFWDLL